MPWRGCAQGSKQRGKQRNDNSGAPKGASLTSIDMDQDEISYKLGSIESKLDDIAKTLPALDKRLTALERWQWKIAGGAVALVGIMKAVLG